ncbi:MAG: hypothetical protein ACI35Z_15555 [Sphingobacterium hotanense]
MKVCIENNLYIESDGMQYILKEYTGKTAENGTPLFKTHGYFSSIEAALNKFLKMKIMDSTAQTLGELLREVKDIREYIESTVTV